MIEHERRVHGSEATWKASIRWFFEVTYQRITTLVAVNVLFLLTSLLVVTIPLALSALWQVTGKLIRGERVAVWQDYKAALLQNPKRLILWGIPLVLLNGLMVFALYFYGSQGMNMMAMIPMSGTMLGMFFLWGALLYCLPELGTTEKPVMELVKESAVKAALRTPPTLTALVLMGILMLVQWTFFGFALPLVVTLGFSLPGLIGSFAVNGLPEIPDRKDD